MQNTSSLTLYDRMVLEHGYWSDDVAVLSSLYIYPAEPKRGGFNSAFMRDLMSGKFVFVP